jgi:hypothetical protein
VLEKFLRGLVEIGRPVNSVTKLFSDRGILHRNSRRSSVPRAVRRKPELSLLRPRMALRI